MRDFAVAEPCKLDGNHRPRSLNALGRPGVGHDRPGVGSLRSWRLRVREGGLMNPLSGITGVAVDRMLGIRSAGHVLLSVWPGPDVRPANQA